MKTPRTNRTKVKILKHHRTSDVFTDGRFLIVNMKVSRRSKRGREIARETALAIFEEVGAYRPDVLAVIARSKGFHKSEDDLARTQRQIQDASALASRSPTSQEAEPVGDMGELTPVNDPKPAPDPATMTQDQADDLAHDMTEHNRAVSAPGNLAPGIDGKLLPEHNRQQPVGDGVADDTEAVGQRPEKRTEEWPGY